MTITVPIRPGAALNDPETRRHVEDTIINADFEVLKRRTHRADLAYDKDAIVNVLANYPWRELTYKQGRWHREPVFDFLPFIPLRWWQTTTTTVLLTDPARGAELGEIVHQDGGTSAPSGTLLFAGDPDYAGVISTVFRGERNISLAGSIYLGDPEVPLSITSRAPAIAKTMTPDRKTREPRTTLRKNYLETLGPWLADHPKRPPRGWHRQR